MNAFPTQDAPAASQGRDVDELRLIEAAQQGDKDAMDSLTERYMPLIESTARWFHRRYRGRSDWQDSLGETWEEFRKLAMSYRLTHSGGSFRGFLSSFLHLRMLDVLDVDDGRLVHVPANRRDEPERLLSLCGGAANASSRRDSGEGVSFAETVADRRQPRPDAERGLNGFTDGLRLHQRLTLLLYYVEGHTMKEIGESIGQCESRISQIHKQTIAELRKRYGARQRGELTTTQDKGN